MRGKRRERPSKVFIQQLVPDRHPLRDIGELVGAVDGKALKKEIRLDVFFSRICPGLVLVVFKRLSYPFGREGLREFFNRGHRDRSGSRGRSRLDGRRNNFLWLRFLNLFRVDIPKPAFCLAIQKAIGAGLIFVSFLQVCCLRWSYACGGRNRGQA